MARRKQQSLTNAEKAVTIDREGNVTKHGELIGKIILEGEGSIYRGENYKTGKYVQEFDYELVWKWLGGQ